MKFSFFRQDNDFINLLLVEGDILEDKHLLEITSSFSIILRQGQRINLHLEHCNENYHILESVLKRIIKIDDIN